MQCGCGSGEGCREERRGDLRSKWTKILEFERGEGETLRWCDPVSGRGVCALRREGASEERVVAKAKRSRSILELFRCTATMFSLRLFWAVLLTRWTSPVVAATSNSVD